MCGSPTRRATAQVHSAHSDLSGKPTPSPAVVHPGCRRCGYGGAGVAGSIPDLCVPAGPPAGNRVEAAWPPQGLSSWIPQGQSERAGQSILAGVRCGWCGRSRYNQRVIFYRDIAGLAVLETFRASYGLDGHSLACPAARSTGRLPVSQAHGSCPLGWISWCPACPGARAQERVAARLAAAGLDPVAQIDYRNDQRRRHLPGPRRAGRSVRVLDLPPAHLTRTHSASAAVLLAWKGPLIAATSSRWVRRSGNCWLLPGAGSGDHMPRK